MSDLIRREDAINAMAELQGIAQSKAELTGISKAWKRIKALPAASPWHRVEEPPKEEGKYLVSDGRGNYFVVWWGPRLGWCYDPKFFCYWMPIEPPKEEN